MTKKQVKKYKKIKRRKIKFGRVFLVLIVLFLFIYLLMSICKFPIKNIYIKGNNILDDQEIIEILGIQNYPSILKTTTIGMENKLEKSIYIKKAKIRKTFLREIYITIEDNNPLFYDSNKKKTILLNKKETKKDLNAPILINYIPDTIYNNFIDKMIKLDSQIVKRISEIKYDPNEVDEERFLLTMSDGNYVYLTLEKFEELNNYVEIIKTVNNKKGILYLDSGEYFKIME